MIQDNTKEKWTREGRILITGAGQRVGLHCLRRLLEQGEQVAMTYHTERPVINELREQGVICLQADLSSPDSVEQLATRIRDEVGPLRALIHNASAWLPDREENTDYASVMQDMMQIHMMAPYLLNMRCRELLLQGRLPWSDIIHITDYVVEKGSDNHIAYAASKAGMANMSRSFAKRFSPEIKVNTIAPSLLMFNEGDSEEYRQKTLKKSVMGVEPGPDVVYQALCFLMDNAYMTGREINLDGGRHIR
ncbi:dihydromonapterin reductase [Hahella sp. CCB-MM4]|uniref:dihydromonapterin reductase n=1 Tax=Hahella sp. (strain CCB-MM4) TaxID=1926491 RepID=UPI000B9C2EF1|nr:dihydromonapterin reductase [Hahella sp. CCB-MM4]OZG75163.1 dihydromonapterin reductase [Hahella sp. CCB-MM4]